MACDRENQERDYHMDMGKQPPLNFTDKLDRFASDLALVGLTHT